MARFFSTATQKLIASPPPAHLVSPALSQVITLPDKRQLGYASFGPSSGLPLLYLHGTPSSRLENGMWTPILNRLNINMIVPDRPGMGLSSPLHNRRVTDYPADIAALARHLSWQRFSLMGGSGGASYVLACAVCPALSPRLDRIGVVAGSAPPEAGDAGLSLFARTVTKLWRYPSIVRWMLEKGEGKAAQYEDRAVYAAHPRKLWRWLNESDRAACEEDLEWFIDNGREVYRQGCEGAAWDMHLMSEPWGFDLKDVKEGVKLWCGKEDRSTPIQFSRYMAAKMRQASLTEIESLTHYTIFSSKHMEGILRDFIGRR